MHFFGDIWVYVTFPGNRLLGNNGGKYKKLILAGTKKRKKAPDNRTKDLLHIGVRRLSAAREAVRLSPSRDGKDEKVKDKRQRTKVEDGRHAQKRPVPSYVVYVPFVP